MEENVISARSHQEFMQQQLVQNVFQKVLFLLLFLIFCQVAKTQEAPFAKYQFKPFENVPTQRAVATIAQDQQGFIWMGTNGLGLNRFNGIDYNSYQYHEKDAASLSNSLIHVVFVDDQNNVWVGTEAGLDLYNREQDNFSHIRLKGNPDEYGISVQAILQKPDGKILVGTHENGLFEIDPPNLEAVSIPFKSLGEVQNILINSLSYFDGKIVLGSNRGLLELGNDQVIRQLNLMTSSGREKISVPIKTSLVDGKGSIWLGTTNQGLFKVDENENGRYKIQHFDITSKRILSLLHTPRNTILCGTENDGLFEISRNGEVLNTYKNTKNNDHGIRSNSIWALFEDNQQRIWIAYYNNGVGVYDKLYDKFGDIVSRPNDRNSLQASSVTGIIQDENGRFWIAMDGGGVDVYDPRTQQFTHLLNTENGIANGLNSPDVQTIFKDSRGNIWVGTWDYGIYLLKKGSNKFLHFSAENTRGGMATNRILSFSEDSKGMIWIGTFSRGIQSYDPKTDSFQIYDHQVFQDQRISYSDVRRVYVDSEDRVWIGGNAGLFRLKVSGRYFQLQAMYPRMFQNDHSVNNSMVLDIYEDSAKNIWIGTDGAGLCRYDMKNDQFQWIGMEEGLDKVTVSTIIQDDRGDLWVAGNNGVAQIDHETTEVRNYTKKDGLLSNDFNNDAAFKDNLGNLYFGSYEGINFFNPEELPVLSNTPAVYLTELRIFNKPVQPEAKEDATLHKILSETDQLVLKHDQSVFTIEYAPVDFTRPEKIQYAYYLEGFEKDWNYVQNSRSATYTNLPAGKYTFHVKAANSDGIWNEKATDLGIRILRPWWFTNFAISLYILTVIGLCYLALKIVNSRVQAKRAIAQERERHLQEEALNDKKIQFFTNISHEFRTPLTLIQSPLQDILNEPSFSEKAKGKLQIISKNTARLKRLIDELMDFRKLQFNKLPLQVRCFEIRKLIDEIVEHFQEEAGQRNILLSVEMEETLGVIWADENKVEKVIFNLLSNAFKSTANNGVISVHVLSGMHFFEHLQESEAVRSLEIAIEDTGKGIAPTEIEKIFDRFYQIKDRNEEYYSGTGIGLEVVRSFVALHRGDIQVESEKGVGTKFRILLPLGKQFYEVEEKPESVSASEVKISRNTPVEVDNLTPGGKKKSLLIVEDNTELRNYIARELKEDYRVLLAEDGQEGLAKAQKYVPDIVITDVIMPKMDGHEFCKNLKNELSTSHIPVLMLTAKAMADDWVEGLESGADAYVNKPFEMKVLRSQLKQLIYNRGLLYAKYMSDLKYTDVAPATSSLDQDFILNIINYIQENIRETDLNVEKLADVFSLSRSQLYRKIKALTGLTANELIRKIRLERAKELLEQAGQVSVSEVSYSVGFSSPSYFSKCFKEYFGMLPKEAGEE